MSNVVKFNHRLWTRIGGGISFEERAAQPSDFTATRGLGNYAKEYADAPTVFSVVYPNWQEFADCFIMRRAVVTINGFQECDTNSLQHGDIDRFSKPGFLSMPQFELPNVKGAVVPSGKYQCTSFVFNDNRTGYSNVNVSYVQYRDWELIPLIQHNKSLPNPKG